MQRYRFDRCGGHAVHVHGSHGVTARGIQHTPARLVVTAVRVEAGGEIGAHEAALDQLFLVVEGTGWVAAADGRRAPITAGEAVFWHAAERHAVGSQKGLAAFVLEGEGLDPEVHLSAVQEG